MSFYKQHRHAQLLAKEPLFSFGPVPRNSHLQITKSFQKISYSGHKHRDHYNSYPSGPLFRQTDTTCLYKCLNLLRFFCLACHLRYSEALAISLILKKFIQMNLSIKYVDLAPISHWNKFDPTQKSTHQRYRDIVQKMLWRRVNDPLKLKKFRQYWKKLNRSYLDFPLGWHTVSK